MGLSQEIKTCTEICSFRVLYSPSQKYSTRLGHLSTSFSWHLHHAGCVRLAHTEHFADFRKQINARSTRHGILLPEVTTVQVEGMKCVPSVCCTDHTVYFVSCFFHTITLWIFSLNILQNRHFNDCTISHNTGRSVIYCSTQKLLWCNSASLPP